MIIDSILTFCKKIYSYNHGSRGLRKNSLISVKLIILGEKDDELLIFLRITNEPMLNLLEILDNNLW